MTDFQVYRCCSENPLTRGDEPSPSTWLAPLGERPAMLRAGEAIEGRTVSLSRCDRPTAIHEAAHAAVGRALGLHIKSATIDGQPMVRGKGGSVFPHRTITTLAGDIAMAWARSEIAGVSDADLHARVIGIRNLRGGGCDRCSAVRGCIVETRHASDAEVIAMFRYLESIAGMIVRNPRVWAAITDLADALTARGTIRTRAINSICRRHFEPGFLSHLLQGDHDNA